MLRNIVGVVVAVTVVGFLVRILVLVLVFLFLIITALAILVVVAAAAVAALSACHVSASAEPWSTVCRTSPSARRRRLGGTDATLLGCCPSS